MKEDVKTVLIMYLFVYFAKKDFRTFAPKTFPRTDIFKLATKKGNDLLLPKRQKNGGSPCSFSRL